jgi:hypothetical protein
MNVLIGDSRLSSPLFLKTGLNTLANKDIPQTKNNAENCRKSIN